MKQLGIYNISYEQMARFLDLDSEHSVVDIIVSGRDRKRCRAAVKVEGPLMYNTPEGHEIVCVKLDHLEREKERRLEDMKVTE